VLVPEPPEEFLTVADVAELLLMGIRVGHRHARVRRSDLDRFLAAGTPAASPDELEQLDSDAGSDDRLSLLWARLGRALADSSSALAEADQPR
jgi:hypothetical protein